jgi:dynein heavy chain
LFYAFILKSKSVRQWLIELEMEAEKELARQKALEMEGKAPAPVKKFVLGDKERTEFVGHFLVAIVWSLGSLIDEDRRRVFSEWLSSEIKLIVEKESLGKVGKELLVPPDSTLYELFFDGERRNWNLWNNKPEFRIARDTAFHDIYVPTTDS